MKFSESVSDRRTDKMSYRGASLLKIEMYKQFKNLFYIHTVTTWLQQKYFLYFFRKQFQNFKNCGENTEDFETVYIMTN